MIELLEIAVLGFIGGVIGSALMWMMGIRK